MIWISHGEERNNNAPPPLNPIDEILHNSNFGAMFDDVNANSSSEGSGYDDGGSPMVLMILVSMMVAMMMMMVMTVTMMMNWMTMIV
jgi:hypothetical protein